MLISIFTVIGQVATLLLAFFALLALLSRILDIKQAKAVTDNMPKLAPLPIPTTNQPSALHRLVAYVTEVRQWQVVENWEFEFEGKTFVIPAGFVFDGASIPRPLWGILSPTGILLIPGLIHDFGYRYDYVWTRSEDSDNGFAKTDRGAGRHHWDGIFFRVGTRINNLFYVNWLAAAALTLMGWLAWNNNRKRNEPEVYPY